MRFGRRPLSVAFIGRDRRSRASRGSYMSMAHLTRRSDLYDAPPVPARSHGSSQAWDSRSASPAGSGGSTRVHDASTAVVVTCRAHMAAACSRCELTQFRTGVRGQGQRGRRRAGRLLIRGDSSRHSCRRPYVASLFGADCSPLMRIASSVVPLCCGCRGTAALAACCRRRARRGSDDPATHVAIGRASGPAVRGRERPSIPLPPPATSVTDRAVVRHAPRARRVYAGPGELPGSFGSTSPARTVITEFWHRTSRLTFLPVTAMHRTC